MTVGRVLVTVVAVEAGVRCAPDAQAVPVVEGDGVNHGEAGMVGGVSHANMPGCCKRLTCTKVSRALV